jgi:hypothetical protein
MPGLLAKHVGEGIVNEVVHHKNKVHLLAFYTFHNPN